MWTRLVTLVLTALCGMTALAGCSSADDGAESVARPVSTDEAQQLATVRFKLFQQGSVPVTVEAKTAEGDVGLQGWVDYHSQLGYTQLTQQGTSNRAVLWTGSTAGVHASQPDALGNPALPIPDVNDAGWSAQGIGSTTDALPQLLKVLAALGTDRPDNPMLLQQTGALWLRDDEFDGQSVRVFATPPSDSVAEGQSSAAVDPEASSVRLWVTDDGRLVKAEIRAASQWSTVQFGAESGPTLTAPGVSAQ
ncbi:hypothetical protein [Pseudoclavibacter sp. CFCC 11306]|uniref:hypothetical protein n=1 Tax=Pseudoclavibacter sp. CFCC 11306 TaxID=1564493 RepID=UPI00130101A4|nr:hypothetical protein [Pseudoclavibacter sp. CFCC 11306]KAB1658842.1 hypothetical protein F8O09_04515 [Pseudoclavibacter sp. CFCC 11306]